LTQKKWRRGFPKGDPDLVLPAAYYEDIYARNFERKSALWSHWAKQGGKHLWYAAIILAEPPILDIGCGAGHLAAMYRAFGLDFAYAGGIDYSRSAIKIAKYHAPWANFAHAHAQTHPELLSRGHYQTAVLLEVLEHVFEDRDLLNMIPSGRGIVASVPSFPTEGHCRWFANGEQVKNRYGDILKIDRIVVEQGLQSTNRWFVMKGTRK
jgi:SAM-dependent methyltransferase